MRDLQEVCRVMKNEIFASGRTGFSVTSATKINVLDELRFGNPNFSTLREFKDFYENLYHYYEPVSRALSETYLIKCEIIDDVMKEMLREEENENR